MKEAWDERYSQEEYKYGKEPNQFLKEELSETEAGRILFIGEGEGRNAVFAATMGWTVDAVDYSKEGKMKAEELAREKGVSINYELNDLTNFESAENYYDAVGIFYVHLDEKLREKTFAKLIKALKPGGKILFECFEKDQINFNSGGPKEENLLYSLEEIATDFIELDFEKFAKEKIFLNEGDGHRGEAVVIRFKGSKPTE